MSLGDAQAAAIIRCLEEWGLGERVVALCFDTTASNTGRHSGACCLIERALQKDLLYMACRHHIMELIIGAAFEKTVGTSSTGPDILLFKRFREQWQFIDPDSFKPATTDNTVEALVASSRPELVKFFKQQMNIDHARDDNREFLELSVIFMGELPTRGIHFQAPGPMHRAKWMSKVIYAIKIWLFRHQFHLTASEEKGIRDLAIFAVIIYLKAWMTAPVAVEAPLNDFTLMSQLLRYTNAAISTVTSKKLGLHMWYLSEELIGMALFDSRVSSDSKKLMLEAMKEGAPDHPPKTPRVESSAFLSNRGLEQFCTINSKRLFQRLNLPDEFLAKEPSLWEEDELFMEASKIVRGLAVVNDRAERGVALIQNFNKKLTRGEDQLQFLLQVVADHRRLFPDCTKRNIMDKAGHR